MKLEMQLQTPYNIKAEKSSITADFLVRLKFYHAWHRGMNPEVAEMAESRRSARCLHSDRECMHV